MDPFWLRVAAWDVGFGGVVLLVTCAPLLISTMVAAALGSLGRWHWPRWQLGVFAGLWLGVNAALLLLGLENLIRLGHLWNAGGGEQFWEWMAITSGVGAAVAFLLSRWSVRWFDHAEAYWLIGFRDQPWQWLRWKSIWAISAAALWVGALCWISARQNHLQSAADELRYRPQVEPIRAKLRPYQAEVSWTSQGLNLYVWQSPGLSLDALKRLDESPLPFVSICIHNTKSVTDEDLIRATPQLKTIERIDLNHTLLTDACLPALADCPALKYLTIHDCPSITAEGCRQLSKLRPDVMILFYSPGQAGQQFGP